MITAYSQLTITDLTDKQTYIKYSASATKGAIYDSPTNINGIVYIGICTVSDEKAPTDRTKYTWSQLTGSKGDPGSPGISSTVSSSITSYCRAASGIGSAPSEIDTSIGTHGWQSIIPETNTDYPYLWTRVIISYTNTNITSTAYSVSSTMDSIEIDSTNLIGSALATNIFPIVQDNSDNPKIIDENALYPIQLNKIRGWSKQEEGVLSFDSPKSIESIDSIELVGWNADGTNLAINLKGNILCSLPNEIYDELTVENDKFVLIKRVGFIDLGTLTWQKDSSLMRFIAEIPSAKDVGSERNTIGYCSHYELSTEAGPNKDAAFLYKKSIFVYDSTKINSMSAADFKKVMTGVTLLYELANPMKIELDQSNLSELLFKDHNEFYFIKDKFAKLETSSSLNPFSISYKIPIVTTDISDNSIKNLLSTKERNITLYSTSEEEKLLLHGKYKINSDNSYFNILLAKWDKNNNSDEASSSIYVFKSKDHGHTLNKWYDINEAIKFLNNNNIASANLALSFSGSISLKELKLERSTSPTEWNDSLQEKVEHLENQLKVASAAVGLTSIDLSTISANEGNINYGIEDKNGHKVLTTRFLATEALQTDAIRSSNLSTYTDNDGTLRVQTNDDDLDENFKGKFSREGSFFDLSDGQIYSKNFRIDDDGNVTLRGNVTANSGLIGGFKVADGKLETTYSDNISAGIKGSVSADDKKIFWAGIKSSPEFYVDVDGKIVATSGNIGGITINSDGLNTNNETGFKLSSNGDFSLGSALTYTASDKKLSLSQGSVSISSFNTDEQTQLNMTKYITSKDGEITFSNIDKDNNPIGSKLIIGSKGLKLFDGTAEKISISSSEVLIGSSDNGVNIANDSISIKQGKQGIDISSDSIDFKNINDITVMSLSTKDNSSSILLGNKKVADSAYMEFSPSGITLGKTNKECISSQMFSLSEKGFIFGNLNNIKNLNTNTPYFAVGDKLAYDESIGFGISMNAPGLIWNNPNLKNDALWEKDSNKNGGNPVNILITDHGMGFFQENQIGDPIAYFSNNKFYVKRTQVVTEQEISGFKWFVRDGSDYVTENGETLHNLGLKWVG